MSATQTRDAKLNQIIQNFFSKSLQVVAGARLPSSLLSQQQHLHQHNQQFTTTTTTNTALGINPKINKWFNLDLEEIDRFKEELKIWRTADATSSVNAIPPLIIETCLDTRGLSSQQTPVLIDTKNRSWPAIRSPKRTEIVLERWIVEFVPVANLRSSTTVDYNNNYMTSSSPPPGPSSSATASPQDIPIIYKQAIVTLRSLYAYTRLTPCWALKKKLSTSKLNVSPLKLDVRVLNGAQPISSRGRVGLTKDLTDSKESHLDSYAFKDIETPLGNMKISVTFRKNCDFRVSDSEKLLSSHFLSLDHQIPSSSSTNVNVNMNNLANVGPVSASNNVSGVGSGGGGGGSLERRRPTTVNSRSSSVEVPSIFRRRLSTDISTTPTSQTSSRPSVSFQPFNSPSLSVSPSDNTTTTTTTTAVSATNATGVSVPINTPRTPSFTRGPSSSSVAALRIPSKSQQALQGVTTTPSARSSSLQGNDGGMIYSSSGSSVSTRDSSLPRYSSSFGSRGQWQRSNSISSSRSRRLSYAESSSVGSEYSSSVNPGSGLYVTSQDLGDFVKLVDSTAGIFNPGRRSSSSSVVSDEATSSSATAALTTTGSGGNTTGSTKPGVSFESTAVRTSSNPLSRFQQLRSTHNALSDSLQSSVYGAVGQRPAEPNSTSNSSSTSPAGKPIPSSVSSTGGTSVNSAHTPVVPSRLSEEVSASTVDDNDDEHNSAPNTKPKGFHDDTNTTAVSGGVNPLDISSPQRLGSAYRLRRKSSSSASQREESFDYYDDYESHQDVRHQSLEISPSESLSQRPEPKSVGAHPDLLRQRPRTRMSISGRHRYQDEDTPGNEEDDDLLFAMSDMHLIKGNHNNSSSNNSYSQWQSDDR